MEIQEGLGFKELIVNTVEEFIELIRPDKKNVKEYLGSVNDQYMVVSKCDVLTTYLSCLDCILIKIDARQLHDFLSSWKSLKFSV